MKTEAQKRSDRERQQKRRDANREDYNAYMREYRLKNKDRINARLRERRKQNPELFRKRGKDRYWKDPLKSKLQRYKLSKQDYNLLLETQSNACAICREEMKVVNIDHCHVTGKVRGLLCTACNTGIGKLKDNVEILKSAIEYLSVAD